MKNFVGWMVVHLCLLAHLDAVPHNLSDDTLDETITVVSASSDHVHIEPHSPPPLPLFHPSSLPPGGKLDADNAIWSNEQQAEPQEVELRAKLDPPLVDRWCLDCICQASSECEAVGCEGGWCGPYKISREYWIDAGRPGSFLSKDPRAFQACGLNKTCAEVTIQQYIARFARDCSGDGRIDCWDFSRLHFAGAANCHAKWIEQTPFWEKFLECQEELEAVKPENNGQSGSSFTRPPLSGSSTSQSLFRPSTSDGVPTGSTFARPTSSGQISPTSDVDLASQSTRNDPVSRSCFDCLLKMFGNGCDLWGCIEFRSNDPYQISLPYWIDAGRPGARGRPNDFHYCTRNKSCAEITIQRYMRRFGRDCNRDNKVDCLDYARIHKTGPYACDAPWVDNHDSWTKMTSCIEERTASIAGDNAIKHGIGNEQNSDASLSFHSTENPQPQETTVWVKTPTLVINKEQSHQEQVPNPTNGIPVIQVTLSAASDQLNPSSGHQAFWSGGQFNGAQQAFTNLPAHVREDFPSSSDSTASSENDWEKVDLVTSQVFVQEGETEVQNSRDFVNQFSINPSIPKEQTRVTHLINFEEDHPRIVDFNCLRCLCEASSGCEEKNCNLGLCGPYQISREYWLTAGWVKGEAPQDFVDCASNKTCSEITIQYYMAKQQRDCDQNDLINCWDFGRMHLAGAEQCQAAWVDTTPAWEVFRQCQFRHELPEKDVTDERQSEVGEGQGQVPPGRRKPPFIVVPPENERIKTAASNRQEVVIAQSFHPPETVLPPNHDNDDKILTPTNFPLPNINIPPEPSKAQFPVPNLPAVLPARSPVKRGSVNQALTPQCYNCLCQASTGCDTELGGLCVTSGDQFCGIYHISKPYWIDSGKPGDVPDDDSAFVRCALNEDCSRRTILGYMTKFEQDCNGDGVIDCEDFALIHKAGPSECGLEKYRASAYFQRFESCWKQTKIGDIDFRTRG